MSGGTGSAKTAAEVEVAVAPAEVFHLLADIEQLPRWAPRLFHGLEVGRDGWTAYTPWGELKLELTADASTGFIYLEICTGRKARGVFSFWALAGGTGMTRVRLVSFLEREYTAADDELNAMYVGLRGELPRLGLLVETGWMQPGGSVGRVQCAA